MLSQVWALPFLIWLVVADVSHTNRWIVWAVITLLLSYPSRKCITYLSTMVKPDTFTSPLHVTINPSTNNLYSPRNPSRLEQPQLQRRSLAHSVCSRI